MREIKPLSSLTAITFGLTMIVIMLAMALGIVALVLNSPLMFFSAGGLAMVVSAIYASKTESVLDTALWFVVGSLWLLYIDL